MRAVMLAAVLAACSAAEAPPLDCDGGDDVPDCGASLDALADAHDYPGLRECLSGAVLVRMSLAQMTEVCGIEHDPAGVWGCYAPRIDGTYHVVVRDDLAGWQARMTWEHEIRHRAAECALGDWDYHHTSHFFGGSNG